MQKGVSGTSPPLPLLWLLPLNNEHFLLLFLHISLCIMFSLHLFETIDLIKIKVISYQKKDKDNSYTAHSHIVGLGKVMQYKGPMEISWQGAVYCGRVV